MRLYDTSSRELRELPSPPGPVRMYFCGPTVYARAHVGNARPFVIAMWLRAWLRDRGYDVTLVHNITDINDKIYDAAPGHSAELAEQASQWYIEDTGDLGLGMPDEMPLATEAFLAGTAAEVTPIRQIGAHSFNPGPITEALLTDYEALVRMSPEEVAKRAA